MTAAGGGNTAAMYQGPAVVRAGEAAPVAVQAIVVTAPDISGGPETWGGRLVEERAGDLVDAFEAGSARLEIGQRSGDIIITSYGHDAAEFQGSGPAPI